MGTQLKCATSSRSKHTKIDGLLAHL
jgi:hypothetical protein